MFFLKFNIYFTPRIFGMPLSALFKALAEDWGVLWACRGPLLPCLTILKNSCLDTFKSRIHPLVMILFFIPFFTMIWVVASLYILILLRYVVKYGCLYTFNSKIYPLYPWYYIILGPFLLYRDGSATLKCTCRSQKSQNSIV